VPVTADFNFEESNKKFDKAALLSELADAAAAPVHVSEGQSHTSTVYDKADSFFDSLSCDALERDDVGHRKTFVA
jgi:hypothetical protein